MSDAPAHGARSARSTFERLLEADAPQLAALLPPGFADAAERYVALLLAANERLNLTRVVEPEAVARLHLLDAVAALPIVDELGASRALDLGTGAGVPGLLLALARPHMEWTLVDSAGKKAAAVEGFARALELRRVRVLAGRAELLGRDPGHREAYDLVTARACAALPVLVEYALPLLRVDGTLLAWKGPISEEELRSGAGASQLLGGGAPASRPANVPALGGHRFVVVPKKTGPTPPAYPRRPGIPARRPLGTAS